MKKLVFLIPLFLLLCSCTPKEETEECTLQYDTEDLIFEINSIVDYDDLITSNCEIEVDDSKVNYAAIGVYKVEVDTPDGEDDGATHHLTVVVEDTIPPTITVTEDFEDTLEKIDDLSLNGITTNDNGEGDISLAYTLSPIGNNVYSLELIAIDASGNTTKQLVSVSIQEDIVPEIELSITNETETTSEYSYTVIDPSLLVEDIEVVVYHNNIEIESI